mmetsp:Transcript_21704/g.30652  ORF Transcript_21704/g.30652 Transcript_21704/m.30652 type:complete len:210 (+) Transcript_21704:71-700(+)|eukprot:CAMPEP_0175097514 /NCGR_PEP_ID=MMETSP0086_2-20121207/5331_1 /TAXON_ID=136419 /ORGANISM="Unknown Unknown, Strain D1" /LENGTH=209 /DNA_ID=CAMNT_0016371037 /DNA_START=51 /DNA_END=680 /DNA_ORIENTATION=-
MAQRRSFYPLPPSIYPRPILDPAPAYQTSYSRAHSQNQPNDSYFFRSRTFHDDSPVDPALKQTAGRDIYPKHGESGYNLPYYRIDSKGFRATYAQPPYVDDYYMRKTQWMKEQSLRNSQLTWAHPNSMPNYRDGPLASRPWTSPSPSQQCALPPASPSNAAASQEFDALAKEEIRQRNAILNDPLLMDPLANAYRKNRTVYRRAFGMCR